MADTLTSMHKRTLPIMGDSPLQPHLLPTGHPSLLTWSKGIKPHDINIPIERCSVYLSLIHTTILLFQIPQ